MTNENYEIYLSLQKKANETKDKETQKLAYYFYRQALKDMKKQKEN